jgi:hypothetical protein
MRFGRYASASEKRFGKLKTRSNAFAYLLINQSCLIQMPETIAAKEQLLPAYFRSCLV